MFNLEDNYTRWIINIKSQVIMKELRSLYSNLYKKSVNENSETLTFIYEGFSFIQNWPRTIGKDAMKNYL